MPKRLFLAALIACPNALFAQEVPSVSTFVDAIVKGIQSENCALDLSEGERAAELTIAEYISAEVDIPAEDILDKDKPYYDQVDDAFDELRDTGRLLVDRESLRVTLIDCRPRE